MNNKFFFIMLFFSISCKVEKKIPHNGLVCNKEIYCIVCKNYENGILTAEYEMTMDSILDGYYKTYQPVEYLTTFRQFSNGQLSKLYYVIDYNIYHNIESVREFVNVNDSIRNLNRRFEFKQGLLDSFTSEFYTCDSKVSHHSDTLSLSIKGFFILDDIVNLKIYTNHFSDTISMKKIGSRQFETVFKYPREFETDTINGQFDTYLKKSGGEGYLAQHLNFFFIPNMKNYFSSRIINGLKINAKRIK